MALIWGVKIKVPFGIADDSTLGIYNVDTANAEFRWAESTFTSASDDWDFDILAADGISPINQSADWRRGGAPVSIDGTDITIVNTNQLMLRLETAGIVLSGLAYELYEFTVGADGVETAREIIATGTIGDPQWTETTVTIPAPNSGLIRRAQLLTPIDNTATGNRPNAPDDINGTMIPASWGIADKRKLIRTNSLETVIKNSDIGIKFVPNGISQFPVVSDYIDGAPATKLYRVRFGTKFRTIRDTVINLEGKYIRVVDGTKSGKEMRKIASIYWEPGTNYNCADITLDSYFTETLIGSGDAKRVGNAWVEIVDIERELECDTWECKSFIDSSGVEITKNIELYSYDDNKTVTQSDSSGDVLPVLFKPEQYYPLPGYIYNRSTDAKNNSIVLDAKQFSSSPDEVDAFRIVPFNSGCASLVTSVSDFNSFWPNSGYSGPNKITDGLFADNLGPFYDVIQTADPGLFAHAIDKNSTTYTRLSWYLEQVQCYNNPQFVTQALKFTMPTAPEDFEFDSVYLMVNAKSTVSGQYKTFNHKVQASWRKFLGNATQICDEEFNFTDAEGDSVLYVNDSPDFYYSDEPDNDNKFFYAQNKELAFPDSRIGGRQYFEITNIRDKKTYESVYEMMVSFSTQIATSQDATPQAIQFITYFYEIGIMFRKSTSIRDAVYSPHKGRIYNDTWGTPGRKTAADMIENPIDVIEHIARLENWSDTGDSVAVGKAYSPSAKIKTGAAVVGSFDNTALGPAGGTDVRAWKPKDLKISRQIFDEADGWSDEAKASLLADTFCGTYTDKSGYECISFLPGLTGGTATITLSNIIGAIGGIVEPQLQDIYCEPVVNYNWNYGSEKFDGMMRVLNSNNPGGTGWTASHTPGISGTGNLISGEPDGEVIWNLCHSLNLKYRQIEKPPSELTDKKWFYRYEDALWYLYQWINWMGKRRIELSVPYSVGKDFYVSQHVNLVLPHQTNGRTCECLVEAVTKDKKYNSGNVKTRLIMLENIGIETAYQNADTGTVWQDTDTGTAYQNIRL